MQTINIGAVANDGTGDPLRDAMSKVNSNFTEVASLYRGATAALMAYSTNIVNPVGTTVAGYNESVTSDAAQLSLSAAGTGQIVNVVAGAILEVTFTVAGVTGGGNPSGESRFHVNIDGVNSNRHYNGFLQSVVTTLPGRGLSFTTILPSVGAGAAIGIRCTTHASNGDLVGICFSVRKIN